MKPMRIKGHKVNIRVFSTRNRQGRVTFRNHEISRERGAKGRGADGERMRLKQDGRQRMEGWGETEEYGINLLRTATRKHKHKYLTKNQNNC